MGYNLELKMNCINGITPPALKERSPTPGLDTLILTASISGEPSKSYPQSKCARVCRCVYASSHFLFAFFFPPPQEVNEQNITLLSIYNDTEINYPSVRKRVT